jgi:hypothetical protein
MAVIVLLGVSTVLLAAWGRLSADGAAPDAGGAGAAHSDRETLSRWMHEVTRPASTTHAARLAATFHPSVPEADRTVRAPQVLVALMQVRAAEPETLRRGGQGTLIATWPCGDGSRLTLLFRRTSDGGLALLGAM